MNRPLLAITATCLMLAVLCAGCQSKFTRQNYETIYLGQPDYDVQSKLGQPDERRDGTWIYVREKPFSKAVIVIEDGRVADKNWSWYRDQEHAPTSPGQ